jgi:hypothetical protein
MTEIPEDSIEGAEGGQKISKNQLKKQLKAEENKKKKDEKAKLKADLDASKKDVSKNKDGEGDTANDDAEAEDELNPVLYYENRVKVIYPCLFFHYCFFYFC